MGIGVRGSELFSKVMGIVVLRGVLRARICSLLTVDTHESFHDLIGAPTQGR